jgi:hypothetical protein
VMIRVPARLQFFGMCEVVHTSGGELLLYSR